MAVNDTYRLTVTWGGVISDHKAVNQFYFKQNDDLVFDTPGEDLVEAFRAKVEVNYVGAVTTALAIEKYAVAKAPLFLTEFEDNPTPISGGLSGDPLPPRTAGVIAYKSADLTARGRGRIFVPPASEAFSGGGTLTSGLIAQYNTIITGLEDMATPGILYASWVPMMWSTADQLAKVITQFIVRTRWSSQRDRTDLY